MLSFQKLLFLNEAQKLPETAASIIFQMSRYPSMRLLFSQVLLHVQCSLKRGFYIFPLSKFARSFQSR